MEKNLDAKRTAEILDVSVITLRRLLARGEGPRFFKVGRQLRFTEAALQDYLRCAEQEQQDHQLERKAAFLGVKVEQLSRIRR